MNTAYDKLIQHLDDQNIGYTARGEDHSIWADFRGGVGTYRIFARVDADDPLFQVWGYSPLRIPPGSRPAIAEAVARANFGLKIGKFEFDCDEGDIRFHSSQLLTDDDLHEKIIRRLISSTISVFDTYLPAFLSVVYGNELPKEAVRQVEPARRSADENGGA